eukprot:gene2558-3969_t
MIMDKIVYTLTDEAPMLATYSLLPIIKAFVATGQLDVELQDISLAGRVIAAFPECLTPEQRVPDNLAALGALAKKPEANIIKLPNVSASIPQLSACIAELQKAGYNIPNYPDSPDTKKERAIKAKYSKTLGSAVNPVLREGNSDRRVASAVKQYAKQHPHSMGAWSSDCKTHVAHMRDGDFYSSEKSYIANGDDNVHIEFIDATTGETTLLMRSLELAPGEVIDTARMSCAALKAFYKEQLSDAKKEGVLFSLHLKATMMKVSDPIMFGACVEVFLEPVFKKHAEALASVGVTPNNGIGDLVARLAQLPEAKRREIEADMQAAYAAGPQLAMVDSHKGITNLHVPSDVIIDASMPAMIRSGGKMWNAEDKEQDTKACIPDRCYAGVFAETIRFCKEHGAFDPSTMGSVSNVGLMAKKAEEYGSHDKTFRIATAGTVRVVSTRTTKVLMQHHVEAGDIWRMCQAKDEAIRDWVALAVERAVQTGAPAIFWLDGARAHDRNLKKKVRQYLMDHSAAIKRHRAEIRVESPENAVRETLRRLKDGKDTISVTGNVLRDYLTDLFPILELGTSAKMLSIVPLLAGGGLFETGAGGSAPKHVQQFLKENHLRWDSLGEFLALAVSIETLGRKTGNRKAAVLAKALDAANAKFLEANKSPGRKVHQLDTRGSHFYLALYWAQAMAAQEEDEALRSRFKPLADELAADEDLIVQELNHVQGSPAKINGYYRPTPSLVSSAMRPSSTFNDILRTFVHGDAK